MSTLRDADDAPIPLDPAPRPSSNPLIPHTSEDLARISETHTDLGQDLDDEADTGRLPCYHTSHRFTSHNGTAKISQPLPGEISFLWFHLSEVIFCPVMLLLYDLY